MAEILTPEEERLKRERERLKNEEDKLKKEAVQLPAEKKEKLTLEEKKLLSRKNLTVQERELLLSRDLTKEELEILNAPPTSLTPRNKNRRLRMIFPDANWADPHFDPATLPPTYDYQFINRDGIEVCMPGFDEFSAQKLLNRFLSAPEIVAVESDDAPISGESPVGETATIRKESAKGFGTKSSEEGSKKEDLKTTSR